MRTASYSALSLLLTVATDAQQTAPLSRHAHHMQAQVHHFFPGAEITVSRPHAAPTSAILTAENTESFDIQDIATNTPLHLTFQEVDGVKPRLSPADQRKANQTILIKSGAVALVLLGAAPL